MRVGYARVATSDQRLDLQRDALLQSGCTKIFAEVARGATAERTALNFLTMMSGVATLTRSVVDAVERDRAGGGRLQRAEDVEQRALPAPVGPEDADDLPFPDRERDRVEGAHPLPPPLLEALLYVS